MRCQAQGLYIPTGASICVACARTRLWTREASDAKKTPMSETDSGRTGRAALPEPRPAEPVAEAERAAARLRSPDQPLGEPGRPVNRSSPVYVAMSAATGVLVWPQPHTSWWLPMSKIIGKTVRIPAVLTLVAVLIGGFLLGVIGALVAVPLAAAILLVLREVCYPRLDQTSSEAPHLVGRRSGTGTETAAASGAFADSRVQFVQTASPQAGRQRRGRPACAVPQSVQEVLDRFSRRMLRCPAEFGPRSAGVHDGHP